jgi:hypothetical protein
MTQSNLSLSQAQLEHVQKNDGGSFAWGTATPAAGPGFMVGIAGGEEHHDELTPDVLANFKAKHENLAAEQSYQPHLGAWANSKTGQHTLDVSVKVPDAETARKLGVENKQEAIFALPGTEVQPGKKIEDVANEWGGDILLHTKEYNTKTPKDPAHFGDAEVENASWKAPTDSYGNAFPESVAKRQALGIDRGMLLRARNRATTRKLREQGEASPVPNRA